MTTIALIVVGGHLSLHQTLERGGTDFAILAKAICQSFDLGQMLGQSLTGANVTGVEVRLDFVRR